MRVQRLQIDSWRNLREVDLVVPPEAPLVCLVGENGTGKSGVLEVLSACSHRLGISQGVDMSRGDPLNEPHSVAIEIKVNAADLVLPESWSERLDAAGDLWDGRLRFSSSTLGGNSDGLQCPSIATHDLSREVAETVAQLLRQRNETQHLYLDADRSYPPMQIQPHQYGELFQQQWDDPTFTRQYAYRPTRTLYEEWLKFFIGLEQKVSTQLVADIRRARQAAEPEPAFVDPFDDFRSALATVLPHLQFVGVESSGASRTILFDSMGEELNFSKLSSGEREIGFLIGQIERFQLRRGLLLVDEPELHLNPDLLRTWLAYLRDSIHDGQVWIATHSLEAVEVAGPGSTYVFEREPQTRLVRSPLPLTGRPVIAALSAAIGAPAFSIQQLRFVLIEGERQTRERERFFAVCGSPTINRFLEGGSCTEVVRRLEALRALATVSDEQLRVGGVIDRDFRTAAEVAQLEADTRVHVLGCHEIENVYLEPSVLAAAITSLGVPELGVEELLIDVADRWAGLWIAQHASWGWAERPTKEAMTVLSDKGYTDLQTDLAALIATSVASMGTLAAGWEARLYEAFVAYQDARNAPDAWKRICGKQAVGAVASQLGFKTVEGYERLVVKLWAEGLEIPDVVRDLRNYIDGLTA